jgi:hypothetical protein
MNVTRTINGKPVSDDEIQNYSIANEHIVTVLYNALRRSSDGSHTLPFLSSEKRTSEVEIISCL